MGGTGRSRGNIYSEGDYVLSRGRRDDVCEVLVERSRLIRAEGFATE